jgi:nucleoside-diphosphate-sugar epimerase
VTVPFGDVDTVADGLVEVLARGRESYRKRLLAAGADMTWARVVEPLRRIVQLQGPPSALGDPWARRLSRPVQRGRAAAIRLIRRVRG